MLPINILRDHTFVFLPSLLAILVFIYSVFEISPFGGLWLVVYVLVIFLSSIWGTCLALHYVLKNNTPLKYDSLVCFNDSAVIGNILNHTDGGKKLKFVFDANLGCVEAKQSVVDYDTSALSVMSLAVEKKFVSSWYTEYVSKDIHFPFGCKELLDQAIARCFQVCKHVDTLNLASDAIILYLRHYKEFKRAQKRLEKSGKGKLEDYFKSSHPTALQNAASVMDQKNCSSEDYCTLLVRTFLKELLPWELWGTLHSQLLASIIAKKLNYEIHNTLSDAKWLRKMVALVLNPPIEKEEDAVLKKTPDDPSPTPPKDDVKIVNISARKAVETAAIQTMHPQVEPLDLSRTPPMKTSIEAALTSLISHSIAPVLQRVEINTSEDPAVPKTLPIDIQIQKSSQNVKIYDKIADGTMKTWQTDVDLNCVSLGQDLLESLDGEMDLESRLGRLWEADNAETSEGWSPNPQTNQMSNRSPQALWFGEDDIDMELNEDSPPRGKTNNVKPSLDPLLNFSTIANIHNMKDLQNISKTTVNQAKHKIGDLQDEAAGVMEGILDFGIAGIRKGLRMTGLQDNAQDASKSPSARDRPPQLTQPKLSIDIPAVLTSSRKNSQTDLTKLLGSKSHTDPLSKTSIPNSQHLVKQQRVTSQDSAAIDLNLTVSDKKDRSHSCTNEQNIEFGALSPKQSSMSNIPSLLPVMDADSPEFEYEEPADFASTIAKLRSLLQQKSCDVTPNPAEDSLQDPTKSSPFPGPSTLSLSQNLSPAHHARDRVVKLDSISLGLEADGNVFSDENDDVPMHKAHIAWTGQNVQPTGNNMQRLDRLFTRTVTGVFNSIKTVVGADTQEGGGTNLPMVALSNHSSHFTLDNVPLQSNQQFAGLKHDWLFIDGDVDISILVGRLLAERRGFCIVEAAQDSLEALTIPISGSATPPMSPIVPGDDLDDSDILTGCPLWQGLLEVYAAAVGGRHVPLKCASILAADKAESLLRLRIESLSSALRDKIFHYFRGMLETTANKKSARNNTTQDSTAREGDDSVEEIVKIIVEKIPGIFQLILSEQSIIDALQSMFMSMENSAINRDLIFQLFDLATTYFTRAASVRQQRFMPTPPPSA